MKLEMNYVKQQNMLYNANTLFDTEIGNVANS